MEDIGYLLDPSDLKLLPNSIEGIRLLQSQFLIVLVTNQSAIARGSLGEEGLLRIHEALAMLLHDYGVFLDAVYACPHHPENGPLSYRVECYCRKPQPGMLIRAADDFKIRLDASFMVGNRDHDIVAGQRAGVAATVLIADKGTAEIATGDLPTYVASDLHKAAKLILNHCDMSN